MVSLKRGNRKTLLTLACLTLVAPNQYTDDHRPSTSLLTPVQLSRLTFFTNLIEQVMAHIDDKVLEADILPVIYPVLKWKKPEENKDMYESAHAAVLAVFSAQKAVSRELAGVYAQMLVDVSLFCGGTSEKLWCLYLHFQLLIELPRTHVITPASVRLFHHDPVTMSDG